MNATEAATWMLSAVNDQGYLDQESAVFELMNLFGEDAGYVNDSGGLSISREILREFRRLSEATVVWDRSERAWRRRESWDEPGRQQA